MLFSNDSQFNLAKDLLKTLRWLEHITAPEKLASQLAAILQSVDSPLKREIIELLPDIIDDNGHPLVVEILGDLMTEDSGLTVCVMEALAQLNLEPPLLDKAREVAFKCIESVNFEDLPAVVHFLLRSASKATIDEVRQNLLTSDPENSTRWDPLPKQLPHSS